MTQPLLASATSAQHELLADSINEPASKRALAVYEIAERVIQMSTHGLSGRLDPEYGEPDTMVGQDAQLRTCRIVCKLWNRVVDTKAMRELKLLQGETICATTEVEISGIVERDGNLAAQPHTLDLSDWRSVRKRHVQRLLCQTSATEIKGLKADILPALAELADFTVRIFPILDTLEICLDLDLHGETESPAVRFLQTLPVLAHLRVHVSEGEAFSPAPLDHLVSPLASGLLHLTLDFDHTFSAYFLQVWATAKVCSGCPSKTLRMTLTARIMYDFHSRWKSSMLEGAFATSRMSSCSWQIAKGFGL